MADHEVQPSSSPVPITVALIVAVIGATVLFRMDFGPRGAVRNDGINKISREALPGRQRGIATQPNERASISAVRFANPIIVCRIVYYARAECIYAQTISIGVEI